MTAAPSLCSISGTQLCLTGRVNFCDIIEMIAILG
jgi:hypothetical protein